MPRTDIADRLAAVDDALLERLGFRADDRHDVRGLISELLRTGVADGATGGAADDASGGSTDAATGGATDLVGRIAAGLRSGIGLIDGGPDSFAGIDPGELEQADRDFGSGVLPLLGLVISAEDVAAFHAARGIDEQTSWTTLSDLGQQAWVHRRTFGGFGLHTYGWLRIAWSGALYWLGRLQFNLTRHAGEWVLSTHIPESGPLTPAAVADSFGRARAFFARHFADYPTRQFHCDSWLLDPQLTQLLPAESNMARFQQLWQLTDDVRTGDADAIFFVFRRRGDVDLAALPQDTSLQRAIVTTLAGGGHWSVRQGLIDQDRFRPAGPAGD